VSITDEVDSVLAIVPSDNLELHQYGWKAGIPGYITEYNIGSIKINGEELHIPERIYFPDIESKYFDGLGIIQKIFISCLYTRHYDGHVREKYLNFLFKEEQEWISPFVLKLLAEYVIEIMYKIEANISYLDKNVYTHFALENPWFVSNCRRKIISYWHYYYTPIPFNSYPSYKVFQSLGLWTGHQGRRLLRSSNKMH
jgi:hypothetical protein